MIIFGTRGITYSKGVGEFHCPACTDKQPYQHKRVRRFFTLYFIPLIPLDVHGEYVECQKCRGTYDVKVLDFDPEGAAAEFEAEFHRALKRIMVLMMLADGVVDEEEVRTIRDVYQQVTGSELAEPQVHQEIQEAQSDGRGIEDFLGGLAGNLNDASKELVLKGAFLVAAADGEFQQEEQVLLASIGTSLEMTQSHVNGVLHSMTAEAAEAEEA